MRLRNLNLVVRVSKDERKALKELSYMDGISGSDMVRLLIRRERARRNREKAA